MTRLDLLTVAVASVSSVPATPRPTWAAYIAALEEAGLSVHLAGRERYKQSRELYIYRDGQSIVFHPATPEQIRSELEYLLQEERERRTASLVGV